MFIRQMINKSLITVLITMFSLFLFLTACQNSVQDQSWLDKPIKEMIVTDIMAQYHIIDSSDDRNTILKMLRDIKFKDSLSKDDLLTGGGFGLILQYSDMEIRYIFIGNQQTWITNQSKSLSGFEIDPVVQQEIYDKLQELANKYPVT